MSLLTAARNPDVTAGLAMWWISGGVPGLLQLANYYGMPSADAAWHGGMESVVELEQWQEVLERNPGNRQRFLAMDRQEFLEVMDRWMLAYCPCDDALVPGLNDDDVARLGVPILVFRSGASDMSHTRRRPPKRSPRGCPVPSWSSRRGATRSGTSVVLRSRKWVHSSSAGRCSFPSSSTGPTGCSTPATSDDSACSFRDMRRRP